MSALEAYDWVDTTNLSQLVANFARVHMLVALFDGDPQKWIEFLDSNGTAEERQAELPVARDFQRRMERDPVYIDRLRQVVREFSALFDEDARVATSLPIASHPTPAVDTVRAQNRTGA